MSQEGGGTRMGRPSGQGRGRAIEPPAPVKVERAADAVQLRPWEPARAVRAKVLFLVANSSTAPVNAEVEEREIQDALDGRRFVFDKVPDVRAEDLFRSIRDTKPDIVHFSGHGHGDEGLAMKNRDGHPTTITARELSLIFKDLAEQGIAVRAVVLNACLAEAQARAIAPYVDNVVGTSTLVGDETAVTFAANFYQSIVEGRTVRASFEAARARCGGDVEGTERIFRLFFSEPVPPLPAPSWKKFAIVGVILNLVAFAAWMFWPDGTSEATPDAGVPDAAVVAALDAAAPDARVPDAKVPDARVPDAAEPDAKVVARPVDAAKPPPKPVVKRSRICARDLKAGRNAVIGRSSCCQGEIPASSAQKSSVQNDLGGRCTKVMLCQSIAAGCR